MKLRLEARVSSDSPDAVGRFLVGKFGAKNEKGCPPRPTDPTE